MNRLLLALLALLAGLSTQVSPAQARMGGSGDTEIGSFQDARIVRSAARSAPVAEAGTARQERREGKAVQARPLRPRVYIPSVLYGPDRALE